jgi:chromosome segregation ATPase
LEVTLLKNEKDKYEKTNQDLSSNITNLKSEVKKLNHLKSSQDQIEMERQIEDFNAIKKMEDEVENLLKINQSLIKQKENAEIRVEEKTKEIDFLQAKYKEVNFQINELNERNKILESKLKDINTNNMASPNIVGVNLDKIYLSEINNEDDEISQKEAEAYDGTAFVKVHLKPTKINLNTNTNNKKFFSNSFSPHTSLLFQNNKDINSITSNILMKKEQFSKVFFN